MTIVCMDTGAHSVSRNAQDPRVILALDMACVARVALAADYATVAPIVRVVFGLDFSVRRVSLAILVPPAVNLVHDQRTVKYAAVEGYAATDFKVVDFAHAP